MEEKVAAGAEVGVGQDPGWAGLQPPGMPDMDEKAAAEVAVEVDLGRRAI